MNLPFYDFSSKKVTALFYFFFNSMKNGFLPQISSTGIHFPQKEEIIKWIELRGRLPQPFSYFESIIFWRKCISAINVVPIIFISS